LEESLHTDITFHIFEDFEECYFLLTGESEGESSYGFFHTFDIQWNPVGMSYTGFLDDFLSLQSLVLEFPEFFIGELMLGLFVCFEGCRCMQCPYILYSWSMFLLSTYLLRQYFGDEMEEWEEERDFFSEPFRIDALDLHIYREIGESVRFIELYIWLREREFSIFVFWFSMNNYRVTCFNWFFEKRCVEKYALTEHIIFV
jgi:hypothetical protein